MGTASSYRTAGAREGLSVVIIARNEAPRIGPCLDSVGFADEVIVVDALSEDGTAEFCRKRGARVFERAWREYGDQKNFAMTEARQAWILILDADERVPPALRDEIEGVLRGRGHTGIVAYRIPRRNYFYGRWMRHGGLFPDYQIRLLRRGAGRYNDAALHENLLVEGPIGTLRHPLEHLTEPTVADHFRRLDRYTTFAARETGKQRQRVGWSDLTFRPAAVLFKTYVLKQGFRDGIPGFLVCAFGAMHIFLKYAKLWEFRSGVAREKLFTYESIEKQVMPCPLCRGTEFNLLASHDRYGMGINTVNCVKCGLLMTNPMPTGTALEHFYRHYYGYYYKKVEVPTYEYIENYELDRRAAYTVDYLNRSKVLHESSKILDVGCGEGSILKRILDSDKSISAVGIEPGLGFARFAREYVGCKIYSDIREAMAHGESEFDLIVLNHVLEHTRDPVEFLTDLRQLLGPRGAIYVDVPDVEAYSSLADLHIAHLYHFSMHTLLQAAGAAGLIAVHIGPHKPPRHPASIRCILRVEGSGIRLDAIQGNDERVYDLIRALNDQRGDYHVRQSLLQRLVVSGCAGLRQLMSATRSRSN